MTSEQLQAARATRWRQNSDPILTLEDAQAWLQSTGLCLFLPRKPQLNAPAPSFVEACLGARNPTPPRTAIETARELLARLIDANLAIPLNLLGTPDDLPDFLVSPDTLPFVFAMRGDRDWKHAPGSGTTRVSPLVQQIWKVLERKGVLSADEIKDEIGRELTQAAALRALYELWGAMRVTPLYQAGGEPTLWEALQTRQSKSLNAGTNMSQVTALSVLVSLYLESAVAATSDEVEIFLSPLSSRSKVREAVRGLTATRQLAMLPMERETLLHVEGSLPEFDEPLAISAEAPEAGRQGDAVQQSSPRPTFRKGSDEGAPGARPGFAKRASSKGAFSKDTRSQSTHQRPPDTISVWPRPVLPVEEASQRPEGTEHSASNRPGQRRDPPFAKTRRTGHPTAPHSASGSGERSGRSFAAGAASGARRERTPARPPWKDKGKPGFAESKAAKGEKARWPRERAPGRSSGASFPAISPPADTGTTLRPRDEFRGEFKPRPDRATASGSSKPRFGGPGQPSGKSYSPGGFRPSAESGPRRDAKGGFRPQSAFEPRGESGPRRDAKGGFRPRGNFKRSGGIKPPSKPGGQGFKPAPAGSEERRESTSSRPRPDFKDFKARKPGDFKRRSPSTPFRAGGGFKPPSRSFDSPRPPRNDGGSSAGSGFNPRAGGKFRQPWKDDKPRPAGSFRPREAGSRPPFGAGAPNKSTDRGGRSTEGASGGAPGGASSRPSSSRPMGRGGFKPRSGAGPSRRPGSPFSGPPRGAGERPKRSFGDRDFSRGASAGQPSKTRGFKGGAGGGFKGGFKRPGGSPGFKPGSKPEGSKPWAAAPADARRPKPPFARKSGFAAKSGGFGKRSSPGSAPPSQADGPRSSPPRPAGGSRPPGPKRPKRKPE